MTIQHVRAIPVVLLLIGLMSLTITSLVSGSGRPWQEARVVEPRWVPAIREVDAKLRAHNIRSATEAWHKAYWGARRGQGWEGMLAVGEAYLRIGEASGAHRAAQAMARQNYLDALFRARDARSIDGVLRVARAFEALGDHEVARACQRIAADLASVKP
jgi:hypothetical protein